MESTNNDLLGLKPYGEALHVAVKKSFEGIEFFLSATCKPALDELGLMINDKFRVYRLNNVLKILEKSKDKFEFTNNQIQLKANPKVIFNLVENASMEEKEELQDMWAGLFASSCKENADDDENIIYISILKQMSLAEAKLLKYICENSKKYYRNNGLMGAQTITPKIEELRLITGLNDITSIEIILNHLNSLKLSDRDMGGGSQVGFIKSSNDLITWLTPTNLALNLYIKCLGYRGTIAEYWKI